MELTATVNANGVTEVTDAKFSFLGQVCFHLTDWGPHSRAGRKTRLTDAWLDQTL